MNDKNCPNPKRVAAGRRNRAKRPALSESSRARLRQLAQQTKPWEHSTGPRTENGRAKVSRNFPARRNATSVTRGSFLQHAAQVLSQLKSIRKIERTEDGPVVVFGLSDAFFQEADRFLRQQAQQRAMAERQYLESLVAEFGGELPKG